MFLAYYDTGMRKSELRLLRRSALDLERKTIRLRPEDTKTGRARVVPLTERVASALRSLPTPLEGEYVFVNPETGEPWDDPYRQFKRVCGNSGLTASGSTTCAGASARTHAGVARWSPR